jgi:hypothetical protein
MVPMGSLMVRRPRRRRHWVVGDRILSEVEWRVQPVRDARVRSDPPVEEAHARVLVLEPHPVLRMEMV